MLRRLPFLPLFGVVLTGFSSQISANDVTASCDENKWCLSSETLNERCLDSLVYVHATVSVLEQIGVDDAGDPVFEDTGLVYTGCTLIEPEDTANGYSICQPWDPPLHEGTFQASVFVALYTVRDGFEDFGIDLEPYYRDLAAMCADPKDHAVNDSGATPGRCAKQTTLSDPFVCAHGDKDGDEIPDDEDRCPCSDMRPTVEIGRCDSGVDNKVLRRGCTIMDRIRRLRRGSRSARDFLHKLYYLLHSLKYYGYIDRYEAYRIYRCAFRTYYC